MSGLLQWSRDSYAVLGSSKMYIENNSLDLAIYTDETGLGTGEISDNVHNGFSPGFFVAYLLLALWVWGFLFGWVCLGFFVQFVVVVLN